MPRAARALCGDGIVDADEDCDLGGTCIGGPAAGQPCHAEDATCTGGTCTTFGGKGCAANCTTEHDVPYLLIPGSLQKCAGGPNAGKACTSDRDCPTSTCDSGLTLASGTSGVAITSDFLSIPLPFISACNGGRNATFPCATAADCPGGTCVPSQQTWTVGKEKNGKIPVVVKASSVKVPGIQLSTLGCGCVRGISSKTCGGTFFEADGKTLSPNCTPGFSACTTAACDTSVEPCAGQAPCAFVHGEGNTAAGEIGCAGGLDNINLSVEQDSGGSSGACAAPRTCPPAVMLSGHGGPGSAVVWQSLGISYEAGLCTASDPSFLGLDGVFCTDDDPPGGGLLDVAATLPLVTGTATAVVHNANGSDTDLGPVMATGAPFSCAALESGDQSSAAGGGLAGAFTFEHLDTVGDGAVSVQLFAAGTLPACVGDCDGDRAVTVDEIILLVNITLGTVSSSACPTTGCNSHLLDISCVINAVNDVLHGCP